KWFPEKGYGFLRFLKRIDPNMWIIDPRQEGSPYESVFCHANELADEVTDEVMSNRDSILEFYIQKSDKDDGYVANNVRLVPSYGGTGL
ncbi:MAG: NYN domain-containing protein, partial [Candidatus Thiodiazotropha endolucinida]